VPGQSHHPSRPKPAREEPERPQAPTARRPGPPNPGGPRTPRGVHPVTWALALDLELARDRLPYSTAEARLLDGLCRWVKLECRVGSGPDGAALSPAGPRWASCLLAVQASARLCGDATRTILAPWLADADRAGPAGVAPGPGPGGVDFRPIG
jgi:hypothetical protein